MSDGTPPSGDTDIDISGDVQGGIVNIGGRQEIHGDVHVGDVHHTPRGYRFYGFGVMGVLIIIAGGVLLSLLPRETLNTILGIPSATPTATATYTPTPTRTPAATPTYTPTPEYVPAIEGELLIIVAEFEKLDDNPLNPAALFNRALNEAFETVQRDYDVPLRVARTSTVITSMEQAKSFSDAANATIVIWGRVDSAGLDTFFRIDPRWGRTIYETVAGTKFTAQANLDEVAIRIRNALEPLYIVNFVIGQILYSDSNYDSALPFFENAIALLKNEPEQTQREMGLSAIYFSAGYIYSAVRRDYQQGIILWTASLVLEPAGAYAVSTHNNRGIAYRNTGEVDRAIADYTNAIRLNPGSAEAYNNRGNAYYSTGNVDEAIADYNDAIRLNPDYAEAYYNRGNSYFSKGNVDRAIEDYNTAIRLNPADADAYNNRGAAYQSISEVEQAIADYTDAIRLNSKYAEAYYNRGNSYFSTGDYDRAIEDYTSTIELNPDYAEAYYNRGLAYRNIGELDRAIADYTDAIRLNPADADAYNNRGFAYYRIGEYEQAMADYTSAIELNPDYANAYQGLGNVYDDTGQYPEALEAYRQYIALTGEANAPAWMLERITELEAMLTPTPGG